MTRSLLGVDFGTSHTVAVLDRDGAAVPLLFDSSPILPSAVYAQPDGRLLVGADAVNAARLEPARFEPNPKLRVDDGRVLMGEAEFTVVELFTAVLDRVRQECERTLRRPPDEVVLTHPATWGSARRLVLEDAATAAGFAEVRLVPEPVAAARYLARVLRHELPDEAGLVIADLGGGTFDASVVAAASGGFEVLAVDGLDGLGGVDIDHALVGLLGERYRNRPEWTRVVAPQTMADRRLLRLLYQDVRAAKERLSRHPRVELPVPSVGDDTHITRDELEALTRPLLERAVRVTRAVMRSSRLPDDRLSTVLLVGGASRMPLVASMLHRELGRPPIVLEQPELAVAQGAALADEPVAGPAPATVSPPVVDPEPATVAPPVVEPVPVGPPVPMPPQVPGGHPQFIYDSYGNPIGYANPANPPAPPGFAVSLANFLLGLLRLGGGLWSIFLAVGVVGLVFYELDPSGLLLVALLVIGTVLNPILLGVVRRQLRDRAPGARRFALGVTGCATAVYLVMSISLVVITRAQGPFYALPFGYLAVSAGILACLLSPPARRWYG